MRMLLAVILATLATIGLGYLSLMWGQFVGQQVHWLAEFIVYVVAIFGAGGAWLMIAKFVSGERW